MTTALYATSIPIFKQLLDALRAILAKADAHAAAKNIDPSVFLQARLYPDMFPLVRQVQIAADFAKGVSARLAGVDLPEYGIQEPTFAELQALLAKTLAFIDALTPAQFEDAATREIVLRPGTPKEKKFSGQTYLTSYGLPQFFFHIATAYAILRHNGVELGKLDYMGTY